MGNIMVIKSIFPLQYFLLLLLLSTTLSARDIEPLFRLKATALVMDFVVDGNRLYAATDRGSVDVFDLTSRAIIHQIVIEPLRDVQGNPIAPVILSVDRLNKKTLFVSTAEKGYRNVWIDDGMHLRKIIGVEQKLCIKEARFIDDERLMLGTVGYEMILYDTAESYKEYTTHIEQSAFSDVVLSEGRKTMATSAESGEVRIMDVESSKVLKVFSTQNVDNIYRLAYRKGTVITAGQDRRVGVYPKEGRAYHIKSDFLVYCVALSPDAMTGVYSSGTENNLQLFNVATGRKEDRLVGHYATLNAIRFMNEKELFSAGSERDILFWKLD